MKQKTVAQATVVMLHYYRFGAQAPSQSVRRLGAESCPSRADSVGIVGLPRFTRTFRSDETTNFKEERTGLAKRARNLGVLSAFLFSSRLWSASSENMDFGGTP